MSEAEKSYADLSWSPSDVQSVREDKVHANTLSGVGDTDTWTLEQCEAWLSENASRIRDRLTELGFEIIDDLLRDQMRYDELASKGQLTPEEQDEFETLSYTCS